MNKVSIIVPVYNKGKYIARCLDSICNQSWENIEIILINDGSSDNSDDVIHYYVNKDDRIIYINQQNLGRSKTRNKGIDIATGKYILFVDADDSIDFGCIGLLVEYIEKNNADCAICGMNIISLKSNQRLANPLKYENIFVDSNFLARYISTSGGIYATSVCNKLFKKEILDNNIRFSELNIGEDFFFCINYFLRSQFICTVPFGLYNYYQNPDSTMHLFDSSYFYNLENLIIALHKSGEKINNSQLKIAYDSANVKNYFKYISSKVATISSFLDMNLVVKQFLQDRKYQEYLRNSDIRFLSRNYKIVYFVIKIKSAFLLTILCRLYNKRNI